MYFWVDTSRIVIQKLCIHFLLNVTLYCADLYNITEIVTVVNIIVSFLLHLNIYMWWSSSMLIFKYSAFIWFSNIRQLWWTTSHEFICTIRLTSSNYGCSYNRDFSQYRTKLQKFLYYCQNVDIFSLWRALWSCLDTGKLIIFIEVFVHTVQRQRMSGREFWESLLYTHMYVGTEYSMSALCTEMYIIDTQNALL